ncbi:FkbM family methyltransferase [Arcobacter sp. F2176]|uniref:FkbM family methyltransferase n=1 Tax=Arcobacter sp. F2176 TaxID=2044511 RepID=UPI0013E9079C|nr:FkbM family methyltransferase [Arcobacter sp. F2176]
MNIRHTKGWQYFRGFYYYCRNLFNTYIKSFFTNSYAQYGEDKLIEKLLTKKKDGFYIDIGANHPDRFSNTKMFYKKGWKGINVEPNPISFKKFNKRVRDINLNIGVGKDKKELDFFCFEADTLSTFSENAKNEYLNYGYKLNQTIKVKVNSLVNIFEEYNIKEIDFLSIDVEGFEMEVLRSNNWNIYKPKLIILESNGLSDSSNVIYEHIDFLRPYGYELKYFNGLNSFFVKNNE